MNTNSYLPSAKIQAAGLGGAFAVVLVWVIGLFGVDVPAEVAAAMTAILSVAFGYVKTPSEKDVAVVVAVDGEIVE